jgi:D-alanine-D-alanine ligase
VAGAYDLRLVVEVGLEGIREVECAVLGNDVPDVSEIGEIRPSHEFYDYEAKYLDEHGATLVIPAPVTVEQKQRIQSLARRTWTALDLAGLARIDFFLRDNEVWVNEVNTMPGFTPISMFPRLWAASGLPADKLMDRLVALALERSGQRRNLKVRR